VSVRRPDAFASIALHATVEDSSLVGALPRSDRLAGGAGMQTLELIQETKLHALLPESSADRRLEASGVVAQDSHFIIIFDNLGQVARIATSCRPSEGNAWLGERDGATGHEDLTYSARHQRFYGLIEAVRVSADSYHAEVVEYDHRFVPLERHRLPFAFASDNKGFEGLAVIHRADHDYVLALCEGNRCQGGRTGKQKGHGRIQVFQRVTRGWQHVHTIKLPTAVRFTDYASLDIRDRQVAVLSQQSSQVWLGTLDPANWEFVDAGRVWHLPRGAKGEMTYCHAEGVSWMASDQFVVVSDKRKRGSPKRCTAKDQSVHLFRIP
jgi:hypothetical protein